MKRIDISEKFAQLWRSSRMAGRRSQDYMAKALGVSKKTVQNWEEGLSSPNQVKAFEWFKILDLQPLPFYLNLLYPEHFEMLSADSSDVDIDAALIAVIKDLTPAFKRKLLFMLCGEHGSSPLAVMEMITAHLQSPLRDRVNIAQSIYINYEIAKSSGKILRPDHVQPDMAFFDEALSRGKAAVVTGKDTYTMS